MKRCLLESIPMTRGTHCLACISSDFFVELIFLASLCILAAQKSDESLIFDRVSYRPTKSLERSCETKRRRWSKEELFAVRCWKVSIDTLRVDTERLGKLDEYREVVATPCPREKGSLREGQLWVDHHRLDKVCLDT